MDDLNKFTLNILETNQEFNFMNLLSNSELFSILPDINDSVDDSPYLNTDIRCKYMDENDFTAKYKNLGSISYMSLNIQSLQAKFSQLQDLIQNLTNSKCQPDVILLQEIWKLTDASLFNLNGYNFIYKCRKDAQGGGVGIYIKTDYHYKIREAVYLSIVLLKPYLLNYGPLRIKNYNWIYISPGG